MTFDELVEAVQVKNPPFQIRLSWQDRSHAFGDIVLDIAAEVRDRETGVPRTVRLSASLDALALRDEQWAIRWAMDAIRKVFIHEYEECFHWKGARLLDPHSVAPIPTSFPPQRL
jgi:hypothetical protein